MPPMLNIAPIVVAIALADVTNLPLILDFAPILTPWFELYSSFLASHLIRFWHDFIGLLSYFVIQSRRCLRFGPVAVKSSFLAATREGVNRELITCIKAGGFSLQTSLSLLQGNFLRSIAICNKNQQEQLQ